MNNAKAISLLKEMLINGPKSRDYGICFNLVQVDSAVEIDTQAYGIVNRHGRSWEHYSGFPDYPVPRTKERLEEGLWEGKQLVYRTSLIKHIISKLEEEQLC
tara:strand:- start:5599 stop:5904 length:306 start_codon:yes stop_codon:yes gene_type:complete